MLEQLGGRKFLLSLIVIASGIATAILSPKGLTTELTALLLGVLGVFSGANAVVTSKMAGSEGSEAAPAPIVVDLSPIESRLSQVEAQAQAAQGDLQAVARLAENSAKLAQAALGLKS